MESVTIKKIHENPEAHMQGKIAVAGWVRNVRASNRFGFISLNDGSCFSPLQVVFGEDLPDFREVGKTNVGAALVVEGTLVPTPQAQQPYEVQAELIRVVGASVPEYPLQKKRHGLEYLRTIPHLRARTNTFTAVFRVRSIAAYAIHRFFQERGFVHVHTPIITGSDCEGAGEMFRVTTLDLLHPPRTTEGEVDHGRDFFGRETNLTVSGQLYGEAYAMAFGSIYTFGPTFRAENSNTPRHAAEFWMVEPEMAFAGLEENMAMAEDMLKFLIRAVLAEAPEEMEFFNRHLDPGLMERLENVLENRFARVGYTEAVRILEESGVEFEYPPAWGADLQTEHERYLTEMVYQKPVFVTDYPKEIKAFYMKENGDRRTVAAMDLLVPGVGEIIGGSQREDDLEKLERRMEVLGLSREDYGWYLDLRRFGGAPHAGFGLGFERFLMYVTGMGNIRDVVSFPRTVKNCNL
ncbi:asparagine--tRNA ligase [Anaerotalea alkaliphila]|uniref:Asparagine--tRNA ligase n=1 Tax=Anaerotalea alkaliphila TaxID=2662126 RepID=A0A7X5HU54_9FIRM|nr:asparagine--tRNA ligase [Anaerotalea alkaliphila]NDL66728.1 asparagine--tRNA ligase [Anaerotalea alkaliphila]